MLLVLWSAIMFLAGFCAALYWIYAPIIDLRRKAVKGLAEDPSFDGSQELPTQVAPASDDTNVISLSWAGRPARNT
ncbi:MAG: hypothetical protein ABL893_03185 [Hyphomicrobium sp.]|nr:hypothetical protein [Hyphomicrobium sp.]